MTPASLIILSGMVAALHIGKMPAAIPVLRDALQLSLLEAGFLLSAVQIAGMIVGALIGIFTDSLGLRRSVITGQITLALASLFGAFAHDPTHLLISRTCEGMGFLLTVLPAPGLIRRLVPLTQLARYLGIWGTYMGTGAALALLTGPIFMTALGWPSFWMLLGVLSAIMASIIARSVPADPHQTVTVDASENAKTSAWWGRLRLTLSSKEPWRVALAFAMYSSQWLAVIGFLPAIYAQAGFSGSLTGAMTALACFANVSGSLAAGRLLHRGVCARHLLYTGYLSMALTAFIAFSPLTAEFPVVRYIAVVLFSAIGGLIPGALFSLAVHAAPNDRTVSTTVGWMQQCSSAGQVFGPPLVAWLAANSGGWHWTWAATGLTSLLGVALATGVRFKRPT